MKLDLDAAFQPLTHLLEKTGANEISWAPAFLPELPEPVIEIEVTPTEHPEIVDYIFNNPRKLIAYQGHQLLLYIPILPSEGRDLPKFHFMECRTIQQMRNEGRLERYVITNQTTGIFAMSVESRYSTQNTQSPMRLKVCKNCLNEYDYRNYKSANAVIRNSICDSFDIKFFFNECKILFEHLPLRTDSQIFADNYPSNWKFTSRVYRQQNEWRCEKCGVSLAEYPDLLHVHHRNGNKWNCTSDNLRALCKRCHSREFKHEWINVSPEEEQIILKCQEHEREQILSAKKLLEEQINGDDLVELHAPSATCRVETTEQKMYIEKNSVPSVPWSSPYNARAEGDII